MATESLFKSAMKGVEIRRHGNFAELRARGIVLCVSTTELFRREQWGNARQSTGNSPGDRKRLFDAFENVIAQNGCGINTRGAEKALFDLASAMKKAGFPMEQWGLDRALMEKLYPSQPH